VVSDHGFQASGELAPSGEHARGGIIIAAGGPIRPGLEIDAHILDVAPTILRLLDVPIASELDGRALDELIEPGFLAQHPVQTIDSFEGLVQSTAEGILDGPGDRQKVELLRSLGYLEGPGETETANETDAAGAE
jgi:arylsulfatase A-like enzyme